MVGSLFSIGAQKIGLVFFSTTAKLLGLSLYLPRWSSGDRVVKLMACGARGPGFDSRPCHLNFQRFFISCFQVEVWLKDC